MSKSCKIHLVMLITFSFNFVQVLKFDIRGFGF